MGVAVLAWQVFILFTLAVSGRKRAWVAAFWVVWTLLQVYALPLSVLQFFTIFVGYSLASPKQPKTPSPKAPADEWHYKDAQNRVLGPVSSAHLYQISSALDQMTKVRGPGRNDWIRLIDALPNLQRARTN
jgi:hypothetical protein